jgi:hypothetical protein
VYNAWLDVVPHQAMIFASATEKKLDFGEILVLK